MPRSYDVGYKKPPKHTQFQPGQSGNPRGRPKGSRNLKTDLIAELNEKITVREGEQTYRLSKQQVMLKSLMAKALKGDQRAANLFIDMSLRLLDLSSAPEQEAPLSRDEQELMATLANRLDVDVESEDDDGSSNSGAGR